jgi:hypothetical protein
MSCVWAPALSYWEVQSILRQAAAQLVLSLEVKPGECSNRFWHADFSTGFRRGRDAPRAFGPTFARHGRRVRGCLAACLVSGCLSGKRGCQASSQMFTIARREVGRRPQSSVSCGCLGVWLHPLKWRGQQRRQEVNKGLRNRFVLSRADRFSSSPGPLFFLLAPFLPRPDPFSSAVLSGPDRFFSAPRRSLAAVASATMSDYECHRFVVPCLQL